MSRTKIRQVEQIANSENYDDGYTMGPVAETAANLEEDLNYIRTQLRILNDPSSGGTTNWHDEPVGLSVDMHSSQVETAVAAGTSIDVGGVFDVGDPYDLSVYLNGVLLAPSTVTGSTVITARDYREVDGDGNPVSSGTARHIKLNFDIVTGDIMQFVWTK